VTASRLLRNIPFRFNSSKALAASPSIVQFILTASLRILFPPKIIILGKIYCHIESNTIAKLQYEGWQ